MRSDRDNFYISGPLHLTTIDWKDENHRRSIAASLVKGVNVRERDRLDNRNIQTPENVLAPPWWEFFHFQLRETLIDEDDSSIFGAIYEFDPPQTPDPNTSSPNPKLVVAFRGTILKRETIIQDLQLDLNLIRNGLHRTTRFETAIQKVRAAVNRLGDPSSLWLAGHSLGAAIALLLAKTTARENAFLETFLFNPPFPSAPIERIKDKKLKQGIRITKSLFKAGMGVAMKNNCSDENTFSVLSEWIPRLFVNRNDVICCEYIGYFEHRSKMEEIGAKWIEKVATQHSTCELSKKMMGKESEEPFHLIPSANLTVNLTAAVDFMGDCWIDRWWERFKAVHGIRQWWRPDQELKSEIYKYQ